MTDIESGGATAGQDDRLIVEQIVRAEDVSAFHHVFGGTNSIHTDVESAKRSQIDGVVQHGVRTLYPIIGALLDRCPPGSNSTLRVEAKFLAPVKGGETVVSSLDLQSSQLANDDHVARFEIEGKNQDQKKILVGVATITKQNTTGETDEKSSEIDVGLRGFARIRE